jgi:hypothetical protein
MSPIRASSLLALVVVALSAFRCGDVIVNNPAAPTETKTTTPPPVPRFTIEFRAVGNATAARIRYSTPADGLTQVVTSLPYVSSFTTTATSLFLSLEVTPLSYPLLSGNPFLSIQIVANGTLFREATSNDITLNTLQVSGTWRQ